MKETTRKTLRACLLALALGLAAFLGNLEPGCLEDEVLNFVGQCVSVDDLLLENVERANQLAEWEGR